MQIATGEAGLPAELREKYRASFAACGFPLPEVTHFEERYVGTRISLRAMKSQPTFIGTAIRNAIEASGDYEKLSGNCRRYLGHLDKPQRLDSDTVMQRLLTELVYADTEWLAEVVKDAIKSTAIQRPVRPEKQPDVSDVGTRLQSAIEAAAGYTLTCGHCLKFLRSLNQTTVHDVDAITEKLVAELQIPVAMREQIGGIADQRIWLRAIVEEVIVTAAD